MACADPFAYTGSDDADRAGAGDQYVLADHVELQRAMRGVAERIEECGKFGGNFVWNRPQIAARHHHIFGERAVAVDADADRVRAQMRAAGAAVAAMPADDMALCRYPLPKLVAGDARSAERSGGKEGVRPWRYRGWLGHK